MSNLQSQLCAALRDQLKGQKHRPPEAGGLLWGAFIDLSDRRTAGFAGPNAIQFSEIEAWCRLMRQPLEPWHVDILLAMDAVWLDHAYSRAKVPEGVKTLPPVSKHPINAAMFDAMFA